MKFQYMIGVDMSKEWFHYCIITNDFEVVDEGIITNTQTAIEAFVIQVMEQVSQQDLSSVYLCLEHTGIYNKPLVDGWITAQGRLSLLPANQISESLKGVQGWEDKSDYLDARRIAEYGVRYHDRLTCWKLADENVELLQALQRQRRLLLKSKVAIETPLKGNAGFYNKEHHELLSQNQNLVVNELHTAIQAIEQQMQQLIDKDENLRQLYKLIQSVSGVGKVIASEIIIATKGFTKFSAHQAKGFARFIGITPRIWESGKSVNKRKQTVRRNQNLKSILNMGALSAIKNDPELRAYYERKKAAGKAHQSVLNAVKNKIIHRIFAVVRNGVMYDKNLNLNLVKS